MDNCGIINQESQSKSVSSGSEPQTPPKIFVGGLPPETTDLQLLSYFQKFGKIASCKSKRWDSDASKCKGYAIIDVADWPTYERITAVPHNWLGRSIECKRAILKKKALLRYNKRVMSLKVFVTGLPLQTTDDDLYQYFSKFGPIEMAYIVTKYVKKTRIGYVCFRKRADKKAVLSCENHRIRGQKIFVLEYHSKQECEGNQEENVTNHKAHFESRKGKSSPHAELHDDYELNHSTDEEHPRLESWQYGLQSSAKAGHAIVENGFDSNLRFNMELRHAQACRLMLQDSQLARMSYVNYKGSWSKKDDRHSSSQVAGIRSYHYPSNIVPSGGISPSNYSKVISALFGNSEGIRSEVIHHDPSLMDIMENPHSKVVSSRDCDFETQNLHPTNPVGAKSRVTVCQPTKVSSHLIWDQK
jgi:RNA recognition motif-containing protein